MNNNLLVWLFLALFFTLALLAGLVAESQGEEWLTSRAWQIHTLTTEPRR